MAGYFIASDFSNFISSDTLTIFPFSARYSSDHKLSTYLISPFLSNSISS